jgi:hypothetical protein
MKSVAHSVHRLRTGCTAVTSRFALAANQRGHRKKMDSAQAAAVLETTVVEKSNKRVITEEPP